jgi:hypothetical protein
MNRVYQSIKGILPQEETGFVFFRSREDPWFALGKTLLLGYTYEGVSYLI